MLISFALALLFPAADGCREVDEFGLRLCPARLPARRWVTVDGSGRKAWKETVQPTDCTNFRPRVADVRRYLARARRTDRGSVHAALPESPCYATGRIAFTDGRVATYRVDQFSIMWIAMPRAPEVILYCADCRFGGFRR